MRKVVARLAAHRTFPIAWNATVTTHGDVQQLDEKHDMHISERQDAAVHLDPGQARHQDVGDQAGCLGDVSGLQVFLSGCEQPCLLAERAHERVRREADSFVVVTFNDADLVLKAVLDGRGIAQMPAYQICDHISRNELVTALRQHMLDDQGHYICYLCRQHLPTRIRVFIDFMTEQIHALDLNCLSGCNPDHVGPSAEGMAA
ncbi:hypothetical protein J8I87_23995 [Paraburkholderia sp. LEh10]|jgi:DNA-binding transcriptional LysR family regulator|nr:hypothetical protein [Paraburkholderia sp. LEh10]